LTKIAKILIVSIACVLGGCSTARLEIRKSQAYVGIDARIKPYLSRFIELSAKKGFPKTSTVRLTAAVVNIKGYQVGMCFYFPNGTREIELDVVYWQHASDIRKRFLAYHELTHCLCNRHHTHSLGAYKEAEKETGPDSTWKPEAFEAGGYFEDYCATSVMHPRMQGDNCLKEHFNHYLDEMFEGCDP
jgi:hypothetical protein